MKKEYPPYLRLVKDSEPKNYETLPSQEMKDAEEASALILSRLDDFIQEMISQGISHRILIEGIFMQWLDIVIYLEGWPNDLLTAQNNHSGNLMMALLFKITEIEGHIPDESGKFWGIFQEKAVILKRMIDMADNPLSRSDRNLYERFQNALVDLLNKSFEEGINAGIIQETLLYCWVRVITLMSEDFLGTYFEKIENNWPEIFEAIVGHAHDLIGVIDKQNLLKKKIEKAIERIKQGKLNGKHEKWKPPNGFLY